MKRYRRRQGDKVFEYDRQFRQPARKEKSYRADETHNKFFGAKDCKKKLYRKIFQFNFLSRCAEIFL